MHDKDVASCVLTVSVDGWPNAAMISAAEALIEPDGSVVLCIHRGSRTTANLCRSGQARLLSVLSGRALRSRLQLAKDVDIEIDGTPLSVFRGFVIESGEDHVGYASLTTGIRFTAHDRAATSTRWDSTIKVMRRAGHAGGAAHS